MTSILTEEKQFLYCVLIWKYLKEKHTQNSIFEYNLIIIYSLNGISRSSNKNTIEIIISVLFVRTKANMKNTSFSFATRK